MSALEIYVSPDGSDSATGAKDAPLRSIGRARDAVRKALSSGHSDEATVYLRGGTYRIAEPLVFGPEDSGRPLVRYKAFAGEEPVLSAAVPIEGWRRLREVGELPDGLPESAKDSVWVADLPTRGGQPVGVRALFDGAGLLERAHSERLQAVREETEPTAPNVPAGVDPEEFLSNHTVYRDLHFAPGDMRRWSNLSDVELFVTPRNPWTVNFLGLESVDEDAGVARTTLPSTYPLTTAYGPAHIQRFYRVENVFDYLDGPGRWVSDTKAGKIYLWPRGGSSADASPTGVVAPLTTEIVRFEGDFEGADWVRGIELDGLTFSHGDRYAWRWGRRSVQHDWEEEDAPAAMVRLRGAEGISVRNCRFLHSGSGGVRLDLHAVDNLVEGCEIGHVGGVGLSLVGFGPGSRDENHHNRIVGNHIHHIGRLWWHAAGVFIAQSGHNVVSDNKIDHTPYCALVVSGPRASVFSLDTPRLREGGLTIRWEEVADAPIEQPVLLGFRHARYNQIVHNEIHDAMELLGDGNGIYVSGTGVGNVVARNYVHDIAGEGTVSGIRLDDEEFHALVTDNVVFRICAAGILTKNINQVENNIIVDCYGPRQYGYLSARHRGPCYGTGIRRNILLRLARDASEPKEPFWKVGDQIGFLHQVLITDNLLWDVDDESAAAEALAALETTGKGQRTVVADPGFYDAAAGDFRLRPQSPALRIGFRQIESWGPRRPTGPATR